MSHGKGTWQVNGNSTRRVRIEVGGEAVVAHVGLHALGAFADRLGVGDALSARIPPAGERLPVHDRGKVLTQAMLMLAGGGESCADIEALRSPSSLTSWTCPAGPTEPG
jgi:Transposase DDE domain group 1